MITLPTNQPVKVPNGYYVMVATAAMDLFIALDGVTFVKLHVFENDTAKSFLLPTCTLKRGGGGGALHAKWIGRIR